MKILFFILNAMIVSGIVWAAGRIQNEDVKTLSQITGAGGSVSQLINDTKIYITNSGVTEQLSAAISDGKLLRAASILTTKADLLTYDGVSLTTVRFPAGINGTYLRLDNSTSTGLKWDATPASVTTTKGDIAGFNATIPARIPAGADGTSIFYDAAQALGLSTKWGATNYAVSSAAGSLSTTSSTLVDVPNANVTITTHGQPVQVQVFGDPSGPGLSRCLKQVSAGSVSTIQCCIAITRDSTVLMQDCIEMRGVVSVPGDFIGSGMPFPTVLDVGAGAGSHNYKVQLRVTNFGVGPETVNYNSIFISAFETR